MTKHVIISTDSNPEYYSLIPLVAHSWHKLGYKVILITANIPAKIQSLLFKYTPSLCDHTNIGTIHGVKDSTVAQFSRLIHTACLRYSDDTCIIGDGDMIVMKDIFTNSGEVESYGFDLTGRSELPMCYVSASKQKWRELLKITENNPISETLKQLPEKAYSDKWEDYWSVDQQLLTQRAKEYGFDRIKFVDRGFSGPVAANRWDRYNFHVIPADIIDVHCIRGLNRWDEITAMAEYLFPGEVGWMAEFYNEIKALQI